MKKSSGRILFGSVLVTGLGLVFASCGGGGDSGGGGGNAQAASQPSPTPTVATSRVQVLDNLFEPRIRSAKVGQPVEWVWDSTNEHSVVGTFDGQAIDSGAKKGGGTFSFTFSKPGTFDYKCGIHGDTMKGQVLVQ